MSSLSSQEVFARANRDLLAVQQQYTVLPVGEFASMNMLDHGHLVNYGGTLATLHILLLSLLSNYYSTPPPCRILCL